MEEIKIVAEKRPSKGSKKELSGLRGSSKIPGVIYGGEKPSISVALPEKDLMSARVKGGANAILHLKVGDATETVILKELQRHPVSDKPVHADFQRISLTQKIEAKVPLHIFGEAPGVKLSGGVLQHELRALTVRALPMDIPKFLSVDVSKLEIGGAVKVNELSVGKGIEIVDEPGHIVVHVTQVKVEAEPVAAVPGAEGAVAAEPELAATKGKKDEEGKLLPKDAKAAPAPEKGKEPAKEAKK